jgi:hypothetical protein
MPDLRGCAVGEVITDECGGKHTVVAIFPGPAAAPGEGPGASVVVCDTGLHAQADNGAVLGLEFGRWARRKGQHSPIYLKDNR